MQKFVALNWDTQTKVQHSFVMDGHRCLHDENVSYKYNFSTNVSPYLEGINFS